MPTITFQMSANRADVIAVLMPMRLDDVPAHPWMDASRELLAEAAE